MAVTMPRAISHRCLYKASNRSATRVSRFAMSAFTSACRASPQRCRLGGDTFGEGVPDRVGDCLGLLGFSALAACRVSNVAVAIGPVLPVVRPQSTNSQRKTQKGDPSPEGTHNPLLGGVARRAGVGSLLPAGWKPALPGDKKKRLGSHPASLYPTSARR